VSLKDLIVGEGKAATRARESMNLRVSVATRIGETKRVNLRSLGEEVQSDPSKIFVAPTTYQEVDGSLCVFCGVELSRARSREHVFPQWLLRDRGAFDSPFQLNWTSATGEQVLGKRDFPLRSFVAGRVCRHCNNGWMSALEQKVRAFLPGLIEADRAVTDLSKADQEILARWATKTAFVSRSADLAPHLVDPDHARMLVTGDMPPVHVIARQTPVELGLGSYATQRWLVYYPTAERSAVEDLIGRSHKTVLLLGRLLIAVCFWPDASWPIIISRRSHRALWPSDGSWLTYGYATDRHGVPSTTETELIDMVVGTRVAHPASQAEFVPVASHCL
jgi:hypothetical protein